MMLQSTWEYRYVFDIDFIPLDYILTSRIAESYSHSIFNCFVWKLHTIFNNGYQCTNYIIMIIEVT